MNEESRGQQFLFETRFVPAQPGSRQLFSEEYARDEGKVDCLGRAYESDEERRRHFLEELRGKLEIPEFRSLEGFPRGTDEDILALSDPPYYTACPNPFLQEFIEHCGRLYDPEETYRKEPFAFDVSEGKSDPIYQAHSYHTKVPYKAIMRYILHYTEPGDMVLDGFCGTGMTGVAAQLCADPGVLSTLGYSVRADDSLYDESGRYMGRMGQRKAILNDLSPAATLIAAGYNLTQHPETFVERATEALAQFEREHGWMYQTLDSESGDICNVDFTVWTEVFSCPHCAGELEFWGLAYDASTGKMAERLTCPHCSAELQKKSLVRRTTNFYDPTLGITRARQLLRPVEIHYRHRGNRKKKIPDEEDHRILDRIETLVEEADYPTDLMMFVSEDQRWGDQYRSYHESISRVHDFHLARQILTFSFLWRAVEDFPTCEMQRLWRFTLQGVAMSFTRRNRFRIKAYSQVNTHLSGTLYVGSTVSEPSPAYVLRGKLGRLSKAIPTSRGQGTLLTTQSLMSVNMPDNSVDYVFIDPPFGDNLPYAELNFPWEAWLRVFTDTTQDTVVNKTQQKDLASYTQMMTSCLKTVYRVLKPGRWMTMEFHNSRNSVWTAIQEALGQAGFVIADVRVLDKGMLTKKQLSANAVNKDLVISAYKPTQELEDRFGLMPGGEEGLWEFVRAHLNHLPVFVSNDGTVEVVAERQNHLLYDRMVAFHIQRHKMVPLSAAEFYAGLGQRFPLRDGMYFLPDQAVVYDRKRMTVVEVLQTPLFVSDEASAIQWLGQQLAKKPQTFQDLHPQFLQELGGWQKHEKPLELSHLLKQNFLRYDGKGEVPSQLHSYLSSNFKDLRNRAKDDPELVSKAKDRWYVPNPQKAGDLEQLRERDLIREFEEYRKATTRSLKVFRLEAIRAGFRKAWQERDYETIIAISQKIPEKVLQEDAKLLMWYDQALTRSGSL